MKVGRVTEGRVVNSESRGRPILGKPRVNMFTNKSEGGKRQVYYIVEDTKLGRKGDITNDNTSIPKGF